MNPSADGLYTERSLSREHRPCSGAGDTERPPVYRRELVPTSLTFTASAWGAKQPEAVEQRLVSRSLTGPSRSGLRSFDSSSRNPFMSSTPNPILLIPAAIGLALGGLLAWLGWRNR